MAAGTVVLVNARQLLLLSATDNVRFAREYLDDPLTYVEPPHLRGEYLVNRMRMVVRLLAATLEYLRLAEMKR